jgi:hypothetical protein
MPKCWHKVLNLRAARTRLVMVGMQAQALLSRRNSSTRDRFSSPLSGGIKFDHKSSFLASRCILRAFQILSVSR